MPHPRSATASLDADVDLGALEALEEREALSFRGIRDLRRREKADALSADEQQQLDAFRASPAARKMAAVGRAIHSPENTKAMAAYNSMDARLQKRFRNCTVAETRHDPLFQSYVRRLDHSAERAHRRPATTCRARPRARRTSSSSRTSSADPGGSDPHEPSAVPLRLAPPPRAVLTFGCLTAEQRGEGTT